jgi:GNAT superfamily N-acetyltransferase
MKNPEPSDKPPLTGIEIRLVRPEDNLETLTDMIHAAYAQHASSGLNYWGCHQSVEDTAKRLASGTAWVMSCGNDFIGTATLRPPQPESPVLLYRQPGVYSLAQFCINPLHKGCGFGRRLHEHIIDYARKLKVTGIALDTAKPATSLIKLYESWGYRIVGHCDWRPFTNYPSVVMYKILTETESN